MMNCRLEYRPDEEWPWFVQRWYTPEDWYRFAPGESGWAQVSQNCCEKSAWLSLRSLLEFDRLGVVDRAAA